MENLSTFKKLVVAKHYIEVLKNDVTKRDEEIEQLQKDVKRLRKILSNVPAFQKENELKTIRKKYNDMKKDNKNLVNKLCQHTLKSNEVNSTLSF